MEARAVDTKCGKSARAGLWRLWVGNHPGLPGGVVSGDGRLVRVIHVLTSISTVLNWANSGDPHGRY